MAAKIRIRFVTGHNWHRVKGFDLYHADGATLGDSYEKVNGEPIPLQQCGPEQPGFGYGQFGFGRFGWADTQMLEGGFGYGRFGLGEVGFYNAETDYLTPRAYRDGLHCFGMMLIGENHTSSTPAFEKTILVVSQPAPPRALELIANTVNEATLRWLGSADV